LNAESRNKVETEKGTDQVSEDVPMNKIKSTPMPEIPHNVSEISFFYENGEEENLDDNEDLQNAPFILISGAHRVGKQPT